MTDGISKDGILPRLFMLGTIRRSQTVGLRAAESRLSSCAASSGWFLQRTLLLLGALLAAGRPVPCIADDVRRIVDTYAGSAVENVLAVGVGVGVVIGNAPPRFFSFGYADWGNRQAFLPNTIFEIGSVTRVPAFNEIGGAGLCTPLTFDSAFRPSKGP